MSTISRQVLCSEHATLSFLAWSQYHKITGRFLHQVHALPGAFYFVDINQNDISQDVIDNLSSAISTIISTDAPIESIPINCGTLINTFQDQGLLDKVKILRLLQKEQIQCIKCDGYIDYMLESLSLNKERLKLFEIMKFRNGFLLRFPILTNVNELSAWKEPTILLDMIDQYEKFAHTIKVDTISGLHKIAEQNKIKEIVDATENYHQSRFEEIASKLIQNYDHKKIVTIAGPSSSNKTTFAKRLALTLKGKGYDSLVLEMDDYFLDVAKIPYEENGEQDWEAVTCLDIPLLGERIDRLMKGETLPRRRYDWVDGVSFDDEKATITLPPHCFLIMEGIHGLNPQVINVVGKDRVTPIYVQATSPINIDSNHRFPASDLRLIRRCIRDTLFRAYDARSTIERWTSVRLGEMNNIFPFQENAEMTFNSAMPYELSIYKDVGHDLLHKALEPLDEKDAVSEVGALATEEATRVIQYLSLFPTINIELIPRISCIREFVGDSDFTY